MELRIALMVLAFLNSLSSQANLNIKDRIEFGDEAFKNRGIPARALEALETYREVVAEEKQQDSESLWRLSMACYFVGLRLTKDSDAKAKVFAEGRDAAIKSIELSPQCAQCHFWAAVNMALYGQTVGVFKMVFSVAEIRSLLKKSVELDPTYAHSGAYRVLGLIEDQLPGILGGSNARAEEYFRKAVVDSSDEPLNYLFLSRFLSTHGSSKEALQVAKQGLAVTGISPDRIESIESQEELHSLLSK